MWLFLDRHSTLNYNYLFVIIWLCKSWLYVICYEPTPSVLPHGLGNTLWNSCRQTQFVSKWLFLFTFYAAFQCFWNQSCTIVIMDLLRLSKTSRDHHEVASDRCSSRTLQRRLTFSYCTCFPLKYHSLNS